MKKNTQINNEIKLLSMHQSLVITKYFLTIVLFISMYYLLEKGYTISSMYILITLHISSWITQGVLKEKYKIDPIFILSTLKQNFHYSSFYYSGNQVGFFLTLFLLVIWQMNYNRIQPDQPFLATFPTTLIVSSIALRIVCYFYYQLKIRYLLRNNFL